MIPKKGGIQLDFSKLGTFITARRKLLGMTQLELCQDICTQAAISQIESGKVLPSIETLYSISLKLNTPINHFINLLLDDNFEQANKIVSKIEMLTSEHKYAEVFKLTKEELDKLKPNVTWYKIFIEWQYAYSSYQIGKINHEDCLISLKLLLDPKYELIIKNMFLEHRILNTIAVIYASNNNGKLALFYYNKILAKGNEIDKTSLYDPETYLLRVMYNKVKTLYDMDEIDSAIDVIHEGINRAKKHANIAFVGQYYYYLGQCYEKKGCHFSEISQCYKKAEFFFQFLEKEAYIKIIKNLKANYLEEDT